MTKEKILEGNKLIADFYGEKWDYFNGSIALSNDDEGVFYYDPIVYLDYNLDWVLLMAVINRIESMTIDNLNIRVTIDTKFTRIWPAEPYIECLNIESKIKTTWLAVVDFIKWYNSNKN